MMLENVPYSNGIHDMIEFKYIIENVPSLLVHLDIPHAFTSGGMKSVLDYINTFRDKIIHINLGNPVAQELTTMQVTRQVRYRHSKFRRYLNNRILNSAYVIVLTTSWSDHNARM
jgi:hypothetical protein